MYPDHVKDMFEIRDRQISLNQHTSAGKHLRCTVLELHRYLQDLADRTHATGGKELDITDPTPSYRMSDHCIVLANGFNITDDAKAVLYNGSIEIEDHMKPTFVDLTTGAKKCQNP